MNKKDVFGITVWSEIYGKIIDENFVNETQFSIFLKGIKACLDMSKDFTYFNGNNFLTHIPFDTLKKCVIFTKVNEVKVSELIKSRAEALEAK